MELLNKASRPLTLNFVRPLLHPSIEEVRPEAILHALSDPVRVSIFANIARTGFVQACSTLACLGDRVIPKSSLSQHFKILREAGLIRSERQGVEMRNTSRWDEVNARFPGLLQSILQAYGQSVAGQAPGSQPRSEQR